MFALLGSFVTRHWRAVIGAWIAICLSLPLVAPKWEQIALDGDFKYLPEEMPSVRGEALLARAFPDRKAKSQIVVIIRRTDRKLDEKDYAVATEVAARLRKTRLSETELPIVEVWNFQTTAIGAKLTSRAGDQGQATLVMIHLGNEFMAVDNIRVVRAVYGILDSVKAEMKTDSLGLEMGVTGSAAVGGDMLTSAAESIRSTEWTTVILVLAILLAVYRAPLLVLVPLVTMVVSVFVSLQLVALLTQVNQIPGFEWWGFRVFTTTRVFIFVVLFGAGTDYCLFLIARYREELQTGRDQDAAMTRALGNVGDALGASALTTIVGLSMMAFASFGKFQTSGPAIAICLTVTLVACVTLAPAMLRGLGKALFWPFAAGRTEGQPDRESDLSGLLGSARFAGFWDRIARATIRRPGLILIVSSVVFAPLVWAGLSRSDVTYDFLSELDDDRPSVRGTRLLQQHFPLGQTSPITILAHQTDGRFDQRQVKWSKITPLWQELADSSDDNFKGVVGVRCLTRPLGDVPESISRTASQGLQGGSEGGYKHARTQYLTQVPELAGEVTRFDLIIRYPPFSKEAIDLLDRVDRHLSEHAKNPKSPWYRTQFTFLGTTAGIRDLRQVTTADQWRIQVLVVIAVFVVLVVILRRPRVCAFLIVSVLLTYLVTIGTTELVFRNVYGDSFDGLDWKVPLFLFVLLIAIGQDYNVYLVTRIFEEQRRRGMAEGLRYAIVQTGGIITSCGVIMAGTFISMTTGSLRFMVELGFALSLGVMLDTCVVRPILVPAFMALLLPKEPR